MKRILMMTYLPYFKENPFNHLIEDIFAGLVSDEMEIKRVVARIKNQDPFDVNVDLGKVEYKFVKSRDVQKGNFVMRYLLAQWVTLKLCIKSLGYRNCDVLLEDMSFASFLPVMFAKIRGQKVVLLVQDIWPENIESIFPKKSLVYRTVDRIQGFVYRWSDKVITIGFDMKKVLINRGIPQEKIEVIFNWGYSDDRIKIDVKNNKFLEKYNFDQNKFYVVYAGNIGQIQNVEMIVETAELLKANEEIRFLIIGMGLYKEKCEQMAKEKGLRNITFLPMQPSELALSIYSFADLNVISLRKDIIKTVLPSKTGVILSCGKPLVLCVEKESEYAKMILNNNSGFVVNPDDCGALCKLILNVKNKDISLNEDKVYETFEKYFKRSINIKKYVNIIKEI